MAKQAGNLLTIPCVSKCSVSQVASRQDHLHSLKWKLRVRTELVGPVSLELLGGEGGVLLVNGPSGARTIVPQSITDGHFIVTTARMKPTAAAPTSTQPQRAVRGIKYAGRELRYAALGRENANVYTHYKKGED